MGEVDGSIAAVIARRRVVLLIAAVVFLVDDYEPQVLERKEECASGTEEHLVAFGGVGGLGLVPHLGTLRDAETGVINTHLVAKIFAKAVDDLGGERYLGQQKKNLFALPYGGIDELDIHLSFARRSYSVKERDGF